MLAVLVNSQSADLPKVQSLYIEAFPENERSPFSLLLDDVTNCSEVFAFYKNDLFCGFVSLLSFQDITHIIYFAIDKSLRAKGYGSEALKLLRQMKPEQRLLADIELPINDAKNNAERTKRKQFYLSNSYFPSGVEYEWQDESYEILVNGGTLSTKEFWDFWESVSKQNIEFSKF